MLFLFYFIYHNVCNYNSIKLQSIAFLGLKIT